MATSFEAGEIGLWSLATACNSYSNPRQLQRASPEVGRFNDELSDIERHTSSCSPDSLDRLSQGRTGFSPLSTTSQPYAPLASSPDTVYSPDCLNCTNGGCMHSEVRTNWPVAGLHVSPKRRKLHSIDGPHISNPLSNGISANTTDLLNKTQPDLDEKRENSGFLAKVLPTNSYYPITINPSSSNVFSKQNNYSQNGGSQNQKSAQNLQKEDYIDLRKSFEGPVKNLNKAFESVESRSTTSKERFTQSCKAFKTLQQIEKTPSRNDLSFVASHDISKFGASDAAEALLDLSEGIFHTDSTAAHNDNNNSSKTLSKEAFKSYEFKTQNSIPVVSENHNSYTSTPRLTSMSDNILQGNQYENSDVKDIPLTPVKDDVANKFHFKKAFCRKFAQSLDQPTPLLPQTILPENEPQISAKQNTMSDVKNKNGVSENSDLVKNSEAEFKKSNFGEHNKQTSSLKNTNNKTLVLNTYSVKQDSKPKPSKQLQKANSIENIIKESKPPSKDRSKSKLHSNLYRNSLTQDESSTESIGDSDQEDYAIESDLSSEYSSESDEEEEENITQEEERQNNLELIEEKSQDTYLKKPSFILSKPKFSLPNKSAISCNKSHTKFGFTTPAFQTSKSAKDQKYFNFNKNDLSDLSSTKVTDYRITSERVPRAPSPKPGFRIKKATFTFSGQGKGADDITAKPRRLSVMSQSQDTGECASISSQIMSKAPLGFVAGKSKPAEFRFLPQNCQPQTTVLSDNMHSNSAATFGSFMREVSFEKLSSTARESRQNSHDITNKQLKSKSKAPYDKHRLPRPTARSPALEAQATQKGRKRKLIDALTKKQISPAKKHKLIAHSRKSSLSDTKETSSYESDCSSVIVKTSSRRKPDFVPRKKVKSNEFSLRKGELFPRNDGTSEFDRLSDRPYNPLQNIKRRITRCDSWSTDSISSSRTPSLCDENYPKTSKKKSKLSPRKKRRHKKLYRELEISKSKRSNSQEAKSKRNSSISLRPSARCLPANLNSTKSDPGGRKDTNNYDKSDRLSSLTKCTPLKFSILSCIQSPASLMPGPVKGELRPSYWGTKGRLKSQSPNGSVLSWQTGKDATELKQKRQRGRWRNMNLNMFCMGGAS